MKPNRWGFLPWADDEVPIEEDENPRIYGPDGNLRRDELGPAIIDGLNEFAESMTDYALEQALMALLGPVLAKTAFALVRGGWKLFKKGGEYFARHPKTGQVCKLDGCFAAGTPVLTPDGDKAIEDIRPGDVVLARSEDDPAGPVQARVVEEVFRRTAPVLGLIIGGQTIRLTEEHPFYTLSKGWTPAHELRAGDWVLGRGGEWLPIGAVEPAADPVVVYNMCVAGAHTFFVGRERWGFAFWVHNWGPGDLCGGAGGAPNKVPTPTVKGAGKIADKVPTSVPKNWSRTDIEEAIRDYERSIGARRAEGKELERIGRGSFWGKKAHDERIVDEENFLRKLRRIWEDMR